MWRYRRCLKACHNTSAATRMNAGPRRPMSLATDSSPKNASAAKSAEIQLLAGASESVAIPEPWQLSHVVSHHTLSLSGLMVCTRPEPWQSGQGFGAGRVGTPAVALAHGSLAWV